jgi:hypothetical protein
MSAFKLVKVLLSFVHLLAQREEAKQIKKQAAYRKAAAALSVKLDREADAAHVRGRALGSQAAHSRAEATLGSNEINEAERVAASLRNQLDFVVGKK